MSDLDDGFDEDWFGEEDPEVLEALAGSLENDARNTSVGTSVIAMSKVRHLEGDRAL